MPLAACFVVQAHVSIFAVQGLRACIGAERFKMLSSQENDEMAGRVDAVYS